MLPSSCKEQFERNRSSPNGVYNLKHNESLQYYPVYCNMAEIHGCGEGGWTLVMKIDGNKNEFSYDSAYWTNKETYNVEGGLKGLTEDQTKLASYWNIPFKKICLGMEVDDEERWTVLNYTAISLYDVIVDGSFKSTKAGRKAWESLIFGSALQKNCNQEGFNIKIEKYYGNASTNVRIGLVANNQNDCKTCNSCIGFGTFMRGCYEDSPRNTSCGNIAVCRVLSNKNIAAFGFILVQ
ncbi:uncharacterized skeletal organic matrix protein 5-like [Dendronephthya gigantea]|uniref:uncharacterized skeletal organic matrix protein 5-like n=1 Tax=Dendronephthya gigantea TaxID=151771 RepID=UPI00106CCF9F|nr:uncharacterized skeletal organic matrix protein 5-like [Dendronephthya gigantea]